MATAKKTTEKATAAPAFDEVVTAGQKSVESVVKTTTETAQVNYDKAVEVGKKQVDEAVKSFDTFQAVGKENYEAFVTAGNLAAKGVEAWNAEVLAFTQAQLDETVARSKALMQAQTMQEWFELNAKFVRGSLDAYIQESTKLGELAVTSTTEAWAPLNRCLEATFQSYTKPFAA